ncbi:hypothetical protein LELG_03281 [Lodderomyces elongisporus NRRL YB-4239]|uniref:Uncharacterized protein n=1 Tax=Lodderomyces elongisporus (strain ATCC 11503 / CBS 2605 / JCM 1781 / NBRC 1676 / NRRL YB-4239) TaxID=379508 RepID=A5E0Z4_LODEL|nr:hypothetical protein LELG_03281 [Lodderomyces elongisporus NRRL YB-4239]
MSREDEILRDLRFYRLQKDTLEKAVKYVKDEPRIEKLISYWRTIAQMASNYVYNEQSVKFSRCGGFKKWQEETWEREIAEERSKLNDAREMLLLELKDLQKEMDEEDIECIMKEFNELHGLDDDGEVIDEKEMPEFTDDFTMKDLYRILKLDYDLVYET